MKVYSGESIDEIWMPALRDLLREGQQVGSRDGACSEILGATFELTNIDRNVLLDPVRRASPIYANAELIWYLSGESSIDRIVAYAPQYSRFAENGIAYGAYGGRLLGTRHSHAMSEGDVASDSFRTATLRMLGLHPATLLNPSPPKNQLGAVVQLLREKPLSRQAVISLWRDSDLPHAIIGDHKDLPCTTSVQFHLRGSSLHAHVTMRSNDIWIGTPYDCFCWTSIQRLIADELGANTGTYTHTVGSLHLYNRNRDRAEDAARQAGDTDIIWWGRPRHDYHNSAKLSEIPEVLRLEKAFRTNDFTGTDQIASSTVLWDAVMTAGCQWRHDNRLGISSSLIRTAMSHNDPNRLK